jgi:hypothetical protein
MMIANVSSIELFTRILDGGFTIKCNCGHIHRVVEPFPKTRKHNNHV